MEDYRYNDQLSDSSSKTILSLPSIKKNPYDTPQLIVLSIEQSAGGTVGLFESDGNGVIVS